MSPLCKVELSPLLFAVDGRNIRRGHGGIIRLSKKELDRVTVLQQALDGHITRVQAAHRLIPIQEKNVPHLVIPMKAKTQEKRERKTICGCRIYKLTCWDWY